MGTQSTEYLVCHRQSWILQSPERVRSLRWKQSSQLDQESIWANRKSTKHTYPEMTSRMAPLTSSHDRARWFHPDPWWTPSEIWERDSCGDRDDDPCRRRTAMVRVLYWNQAYHLWSLGGRVTACEKQYNRSRYRMLFRWCTDSLLSRIVRILASPSECGVLWEWEYVSEGEGRVLETTLFEPNYSIHFRHYEIIWTISPPTRSGIFSELIIMIFASIG